MGMYCCCGVKIRDEWICECDWEGWFLCWKQERDDLYSIPVEVQVKEIPDKDGTYLVRIFEDCDYDERESEFSLIEKNWGEYTDQAISHWKISYYDGYMGYRGVYAWKEIK